MQSPAPFTVEESAELLAVSFMNNMLNRVTIAQLTENETLPMMGVLRPLMQIFPSLQAIMFKTVMKPGSKDSAPAGLSEEVRPPPLDRRALSSSFYWAAPMPHIAEALAYLEHVVNFHLRGRFLPLGLWCAPYLCGWPQGAVLHMHTPSGGRGVALSAWCAAPGASRTADDGALTC
jgi:hypothetical protein